MVPAVADEYEVLKFQKSCLVAACCSGINVSAVLREPGVVTAGGEGYRGRDGYGEHAAGRSGGKFR